MQSDLYVTFRQLLDQGSRLLLTTSDPELGVGEQIDRLQPTVHELAPKLGELLRGDDQARFTARVSELTAEGVPEDLARRAAALSKEFILLDVVDLASDSNATAHVAEIFLDLAETLRIGQLFDRLYALPADDPWDALARSALQADVFALLGILGRSVLTRTEEDKSASQRVEQWQEANEDEINRAHAALNADAGQETNPLARLTVIVRILRALAA